jgi:hypothetical protein
MGLLAAGFVLAGVLLQARVGTAAEATPARAPVATTGLFAFFSDFETNLNDALIAAGLARKDGKPEPFRADPEASCFEKLAASRRAGWDAAVDYYAKIISPGGWMSRPQFLIRMQLVGFDGEWQTTGAEFVEIAQSFRNAAAPAYRSCRWAAQDGKNRRWIAELEPALAADERTAATRLERLYQKRWRALPMLVDVVETVDWSGANSSWSDFGQGDILVSSSTSSAAAFETLWHEASHVLMDRGDPVRQALEDAAKAAKFELPKDLWHVVLFYGTGETVRRIRSERGQPDYTPMVYEIYARGSWTEYREALETQWLPYVEGKRTLQEAATGLIAALQKPAAR